MSVPTLDEIVGWGLAIGVGLGVAVCSFFGICALFGIEWHDDKEHKA